MAEFVEICANAGRMGAGMSGIIVERKGQRAWQGLDHQQCPGQWDIGCPDHGRFLYQNEPESA